jgi:hypothetical protein
VEITVTTETGTTTIPKVCDLVFHRKGQPVGDFRKVLRRACIAAGLCVTLTDGQGKETKKATTMFHDLGGHACGTSKRWHTEEGCEVNHGPHHRLGVRAVPRREPRRSAGCAGESGGPGLG